MLPLELKVDKDGLLYLEDDEILKTGPLLIDKRNFRCERYYQNGFYRINGNDDYIVKYSYTSFTRKERQAIKNMIFNLVQKQYLFPDIDFPIGYFKKDRQLSGLIVKYYKDSISCENVFDQRDLFAIATYYDHEEGAVRNLFHLFNNILNIAYRLFEEDIYYIDLNPGNFLFVNNDIKLIDFDHIYVRFDKKDKCLESIMGIYSRLLKEVLTNYHLLYECNEPFTNFEEAKVLTKKIENKIIKGR